MKTILFIYGFFVCISSLAQTGNVGIGTTNPQAQLHTTGTVRHESLKGVGDNPVYSDRDGNLFNTSPYVKNYEEEYIFPTCITRSFNNEIKNRPFPVDANKIAVKIDFKVLDTENIIIHLTSPSGQILTLLNEGIPGTNFTNTTFADQAKTTLENGVSPYSGHYKPSGSLSSTCSGVQGNITTFGAFGEDGYVIPNGVWKLNISSTAGQSVEIKFWSISFNEPEPWDGKFIADRIGIGSLNPNAPLQFKNETASRKIVLFEAANNDHQFYGLGVDGGALRYQVDHPGADHVFYAGAGSAASTELIRIKGNGKIGIGTPEPSAMLSVNGRANKIGGGNWETFSDLRVKKDIRNYDMGLREILKIRPVHFRYNELSGYQDTDKEYVGIIAQEIEKVLPSTVTQINTDSKIENKRVYDSSELIYTLINAVKELNDKNTEQNARILLLESQQKVLLELAASAIENQRSVGIAEKIDDLR